jgi:hypothetical protein
VAFTVQHLRTSDDPAAFELDVTIGKLRTQCVRWFVQAFDTIQNPDLVKKAFERCIVPGSPHFNLSHESVTSADTIGALLDLQENNPKFWAELQGSSSTEDVADTKFDEPLFNEELNLGDTTNHPTNLIESLIAGIPSQALGVNAELAWAPVLMADDLDADISNVTVPVLMLPSEQPERARGKRVIVANKLYSMDMYDRDPSGDAEEEKVKPKRRGCASKKK